MLTVLIAALLALYIGMALRSDVVWLIPTLRILTRRGNPAGYWAVIGAAALVLTILVALAAYAAHYGRFPDPFPALLPGRAWM
jgi:hypothetical protein